jgi:hypothetical protein
MTSMWECGLISAVYMYLKAERFCEVIICIQLIFLYPFLCFFMYLLIDVEYKYPVRISHMCLLMYLSIDL